MLTRNLPYFFIKINKKNSRVIFAIVRRRLCSNTHDYPVYKAIKEENYETVYNHIEKGDDIIDHQMQCSNFSINSFCKKWDKESYNYVHSYV